MLGLIWAQSRGGVIGRDGTLPWHLPEDLARFREVTTAATVVMGRRTWESLPDRFRPLPGRRNVVLTRQPSYDAPGADVVATLADALAAAAESGGDIWVIGGAAVYHEAMPLADRLAITDVDGDYDGDVSAPEVGPAWHVVAASEWQASSTGIRFRWRDLRRANG